MKWIRRLFGWKEEGKEEAFKDHYFEGEVDTFVLRGKKIAKDKVLGNWDVMWYGTLFLREDGSYTVMNEVEDIGIERSFHHGLTEEDVREKYPGLARRANFTRRVEV